MPSGWIKFFYVNRVYNFNVKKRQKVFLYFFYDPVALAREYQKISFKIHDAILVPELFMCSFMKKYTLYRSGRARSL